MRRNAVLLSVTLMCLLITSVSHSKDLPFQGKGVWIQKTSMNNPLIFSDAFSWYITVGENMNEPFIDKLKGPLVLAFSGKNVSTLKEFITKYRGKIVAVVWDYEIGSSKSQAESDLKAAHKYANDNGLPFGVVVLANPDASLRKNGVNYTQAKDFADFLLPMLYCQWWNCDQAVKTRNNFEKVKSLTDLPLVALVAIKTSMTKKPTVLTSQNIQSNYRGLSPYAFAFYNVEDLDNAHLGAIRQLK
jgi:hypothetical protein